MSDTERPAVGAKRRLYSIVDAQQSLGNISRTTLYRLVKAGELTQVRIGRRGYVTAESVDDYLGRLIRETAGVA